MQTSKRTFLIFVTVIALFGLRVGLPMLNPQFYLLHSLIGFVPYLAAILFAAIALHVAINKERAQQLTGKSGFTPVRLSLLGLAMLLIMVQLVNTQLFPEITEVGLGMCGGPASLAALFNPCLYLVGILTVLPLPIILAFVITKFLSERYMWNGSRREPLTVALFILAIIGSFVFWQQNPSVISMKFGTSTPQSVESISTNNLATQTLTAKSNLYSLEIPGDWIVTKNTSSLLGDGQTVQVRTESPDWSYYTAQSDGPCDPIYYKNGAMLNAVTFLGTTANPHPHDYLEGAVNSKPGIISEKKILIDGIEATYHDFIAPCLTEGRALDAHVIYKGGSHAFTFFYNANSYPRGEEVFSKVLSSIKFTK